MEKENQIFGIRAIIEAVNAGKEIDKVFIQTDAQSELMQELLKRIGISGILLSVTVFGISLNIFKCPAASLSVSAARSLILVNGLFVVCTRRLCMNIIVLLLLRIVMRICRICLLTIFFLFLLLLLVPVV